MKKKPPLVTILLLILLISTACHFHHHRIRTVRVNNDNSSLKIEYCGQVIFNDNETAIEDISPDGYVKYSKDDKRFVVRGNADGSISYRLSDDGMPLDYNDPDSKAFIARAVREIAFHYNQ